MRNKIVQIVFIIIWAHGLNGQSVTLGGNASFWIGGQASFTAGGDATFNGVLTNEGTITSYNDLDFVDNINVGSLRFVGIGDQNLSGDSINVVDIEVNKTGDVILLTNQVIVTGSLDVTNGVIQAENEDDLLVSGGSNESGDGYVEGKLLGITRGVPVSFPMGINGFPNYITLSNTVNNTTLRVECVVPDPATLKADGDVQEISDEVEWLIQTTERSSISETEALVTASFSGIDLSGSVYGKEISADVYRPAILALVPGDSLYRVLNTVSEDNWYLNTDATPTSDALRNEATISITNEPIRLVIGWIPVVDDIEFFIPNSFAPNGIFEENRSFRPFISGEVVTSFKMSIFNSFNSEVYGVATSGDALDISLFGWNGRLRSGQEAPGGVYYYTIDLIHENGREQHSGSFLLVE